ncbi:DNA primase [methanotrophic endosymbiont of Bathymodiolus puteoserpentis (Logatchev)]|jgi:DNA primase|uniref:DNA primase n=1 Tax=methanotrophic endosymbiont of Bathymodiolus puteoserpentis (Logatchev) TaxID=343235 RepID=UPI0013C5D7F7|nr:DNA primase [methanotrophic endosymbiont of Bathymodiolus puteoserpentis (Logatchev)]SHE19092.1 DNA primase [methanotrophic endosymbiont of Bathymodiolus puteoserpentis (Logatchev)]
MAGKIPRSFIDDLLVRVDLVDLVDSYVPLKKAGSSYVARCPFHTEKTPSFSVTRNKQLYHCFGCGAGGNAISFLMDYGHLNFVEAVEDLADFVGVEVPREANADPVKKNNTAEILQLLEQVTGFYIDQLRDNVSAKAAVDYFKSRGLSGEVAQEFQLGYAPAGWDALSKRFKSQQLMEAGLVVAKDSGAVYDRFRDRVIFPIRDRRGRVLGFGGRVLDDSLPKYLNSPETAVFHKGREVYGLYELLARNAKPERILVVEGYMDVIALSQFGLGYAVATLGTATSKEHLELLFRFSSEIVLCFDGDKAGRAASWRAVEAALPSLKDGRQVKIMQLPAGDDPDILVRQEGLVAFEQRIASAASLSAFFFDRLKQGLNLNDLEGRASLASKAKGYLEKIPSGVFQDLMLEKLKEISKVDQLDFFGNPTTLKVSRHKQKQADVKLSPVRIAISLLLQNPSLIDVLEEKNINWQSLNFPGISLLKTIVEIIVESPNINLPSLLEYFRGKEEESYIGVMMNHDFFISGDELKEEFSGAIDRLISQGQESRLDQLIAKERASGLSEHERKELLSMLANRK